MHVSAGSLLTGTNVLVPMLLSPTVHINYLRHACMIIGTHIPPIPLESDIDFKNDMIMEYMKSNLNYLGTLCVGTK